MDKYLNWLHAIGDVLAITIAVYALPRLVAGTYRTVKNWWSLRSHQRTTKRLAELESELTKLELLPDDDMEHERVVFYNWLAVMMTCIAAGSMGGTGYLYIAITTSTKQTLHPALLALSLIMFIIATLVGWWGMNRFQRLLPSHKKAKRQQIKVSIRYMKDKLDTDGRPIT
jgi:uncharacterized membrane protein